MGSIPAPTDSVNLSFTPSLQLHHDRLQLSSVKARLRPEPSVDQSQVLDTRR